MASSGQSPQEMRGQPPVSAENSAELDAADRRILRALQADGRLSNKALAARVHLSESATLARTRRLLASGVIRGVRALIAPAPG